MGGDPDGDALSYSILNGLPAGAFFDAQSGTLEWTPTYEQAGDYTVTFGATDVYGATASRSVVVHVSNVNRPPVLTLQNHAVLLGQELRFLVQGTDPDANSTLTFSALDLPEGAALNAATGEIVWTPTPGQAGDHLVRVSVSDGSAVTTLPLLLRALTEAQAPVVTIETTPSFPALPGQDVVVHVLASSFSGIANVTLRVDGQLVTLDSFGRATVRSTSSGKIELVATATDADGFVGTLTQTLKIRDPNDRTAPQVAFDTNTAQALLTAPATLRGVVSDTNLDQWVLSIAHQGSDQFTELARGSGPISGALAQLDTNAWANGVYRFKAVNVRLWYRD